MKEMTRHYKIYLNNDAYLNNNDASLFKYDASYFIIIYFISSIHTFNTYGVWLRHRALRYNLLSKNHSKGFPLQSLTRLFP